MTRWQADTDDMQRLFRHHTQPIPAPVSARIRRRVMRRARLLRWQHRAAQLWQLATANAWDVVFVLVLVIWLLWH